MVRALLWTPLVPSFCNRNRDEIFGYLKGLNLNEVKNNGNYYLAEAI